MASHDTRFTPPFCPNPDCDFHADSRGWLFRRWGTYRRTTPRVRRVVRFRCSHCDRTFSSQTFHTTYWLRRPELLATTFERLVAGSGLRQIARSLGCSPTTVMTHAARLGRHCLLYRCAHGPKQGPAEPLVIDGFESFAFSQYYPLHLNLAVGANSHFVYHFTESELRRKGRMTAEQRKKRALEEARYGRPDPGAIEQGIWDLLEATLPEGSFATVRSDDHRAYPRAIGRLENRQIRHEITSSKAARTTGNPLFPVNRQDQMLRHSGANHRRETIAFSKLRAGVVERAAIQLLWMSFMKPFSEKKQDATPAERLGLQSEPLTIRQCLRWRLFPSRIPMPAPWREYYRRAVATRRIPESRRHALTLAF